MTDKPTNEEPVANGEEESLPREAAGDAESLVDESFETALSKDDSPDSTPSSQEAAAFEAAETLITPATGIANLGEDLSETPVAGDDHGRTREIPTEPQLHFGRFLTEGIIGKGGMGVVFKAVDPLIGRTVAIKALRTDHGIGGDSLTELQSRFELEFKSAGNLSHPNIVTIFDVGQEEGTTFIAMEFIDGRSLEQLLREGDVLSYERIAELIGGICSGLDYAHEAGIVHRDIKPANILIDPAKGRPKITDFGVAKVQSSGLTQTGTVIGTPAYMSPEQILGKDVSGRSDQFSAAVILYQMLTGILPFGSDTPASILYRIVHSEPTPPHELNPEIPEGFSTAIAKAFAKDSKERYESCAEMAEVTSRALLGKAPPNSELDENANPSSFKSVTLSTTEPLRGSGTYAGAGSWWQRQSSAPRIGMSLLGALLFASIGFVAVATYLDKPLPFGLQLDDIPFLSEAGASQPGGTATNLPEDSNSNTSSPGSATTNTVPTAVPGSDVEKPTAPVNRTYTIDSNKKGASIHLDGKALEGVTPFDVQLTVGEKYEIAVSLEGYKSAGAKITATPDGEKGISLTLTPNAKPGRLAFTKPEDYGRLIFEVDGKRVDPSKIPPGKKTLVVRSPTNYFVSAPQSIHILEDKATAIKALPVLQKISISGIGSGTNTVSIDGSAPIPLPNHELWLARDSRHRFSFTFDNGDQRERTLFIRPTVSAIIGSPKEIKVRRR